MYALSMNVCMWACTYVHVHGEVQSWCQVSCSVVPYLLCWGRLSCWTWSWPFWPACLLKGFLSLSSHAGVMGEWATVPTWLLSGFRDLKSNPQACTANASSTEPSPHPHNMLNYRKGVSDTSPVHVFSEAFLPSCRPRIPLGLILLSVSRTPSTFL